MHSRTLLLAALLASLTCAVSCQWSQHRGRQDAAHSGPKTAATLPVPQPLYLDVPPAFANADLDAWLAARAAYARNGDLPLWFEHGRPRADVAGLRDAIEHSAADGMDPTKYERTAVAALAARSEREAPLDPTAATEADLKLTFAAVRLAHDLQQGVMVPEAIDRRWAESSSIDYGAVVYEAAHAGNVEAGLRSLAPQHPQYQRLRDSLVRYRELAQQPPWPMVPESSHVKPGKAGPEIAAVRARLIASGDLEAPEAVGKGGFETASAVADDVLDEPLMTAIKQFQRGHGLNDDGVPGADTLAAMNVPVAERVRQLEMNLERWRWLPEQLGDTHVLVNVPTFQLTAVQDRVPVLQMRVVTGRSSTPTPIFHSAINSLVLSPYWNVPKSILRGEVRPGLAKDPNYLNRKNMEVVRNGHPVDPYSVDLSDPSVRVRQRPGADNALGHVKFLFPNDFDVYLHDTPLDSLFARAERSLSHGCIRLEKPFELARWVLRDRPEWTDEKIQEAMDSGSEQHVAITNEIPVYVVYQTVWVEDDGTVIFAKDLYGHDERQARALPQAMPDVATTLYARDAP
jgi:murein L,D-transpeptidase YcbB/YkuD